MAAKHFTATVEADGSVRLPKVDLQPGTEVEILLFGQEDFYEDNPGILCALLAQSTLAREWDTPEEDEAWKDL